MKKEIFRQTYNISANYNLPEYFISTLAIPHANRSDAIPLLERPKPWPNVDTVAIFSLIWDDDRPSKPAWYGTFGPKGTDCVFFHVHSWPKFLTEQAAESSLTKLTAVMIGGTFAPIIGGLLAGLVPRELAAARTFTGGISDNGYPVTIVLSGFNL